MSFSSDVKKELCAVQCFDREMLKAELYGILLFGKVFREDQIIFTTESAYAAKRVTFLLENLYMPKNKTLCASVRVTAIFIKSGWWTLSTARGFLRTSGTPPPR